MARTRPGALATIAFLVGASASTCAPRAAKPAANAEGLMVRGSTPLSWLEEDLPLTLWVAHELMETHRAELDSARRRLNELAGRELFAAARRVPESVGPAELPRGHIAVRADRSFRRGETDVRYDRGTGAILSAVVHVPFDLKPDRARGFWLHELMHALGFAHSDRPMSIMWPKLSKRSERIDGADAALLRRHYARQ